MSQSASRGVRKKSGLIVLVVLELLVLLGLFWSGFLPNYTLFSNDGPLGAIAAECRRLPSLFSGGWMDLSTLGYREGGAAPSFTYALQWVLGPLWFSRIYAPFSLLLLGISAWCFFRQLGFAPLACWLAGIAATLNSGFLGAACWGMAAHPIAIAMTFLALAALVDNSSRPWWLRVPLGGLAVGMAVMEGADIGAILSLYVAAFAIYQAWISPGPRAKNLLLGVSRVAVVAVFAALLAAYSLSVLITTQIKGVAGMQQDKETKEKNWDFATQWSLPKREALGFAIPGLFGYRMDTPDGGAYWGAVGRDPNWDRYFANGKQGPAPGGFMRFSGGGVYAGILVLLIATWSVCQSLRNNDSAFSLTTRRWIWFWLGVFVVSLLLAFGRFAPFYKILYALPYFSTIRNPAKFTYPCNIALVVLFAYGVNGLCRLYLEPQSTKTAAVRDGLMAWWGRVRGFDRRWTIGTFLVLGVAAVGWLIFASSGDAFERYLQEVQFDAATAHSIAGFSVGQAGLFLLFFAAAAILFTWLISGAFRGPRAKWAAILLGGLLVIDLGRADQPWVVVWNYAEKYASNPIIDFLRKQPEEHRVAGLPAWFLSVFPVQRQLAEAEQNVHQMYAIEWAQHHFLYYNIQSLDVIQMPRMPEDLASYVKKFFPQSSADLPRVAREWQLTNTRYLLGATDFVSVLNQHFDPSHQRFRIAERFNIVPKPEIARPTKLDDLTAVVDTNGPFAVIEFTGVLPRAALYAHWQVSTNDQVALDELASPSFDPEKTVLVSGNVPTVPSETPAIQNAGNVTFKSYAPKDIVFAAAPAVPSVLLLNDRFDPNWKVFVDDKPEALLRCNYIMRGVYLTPGSHKVEFRFIPPMGTFYVSLAAVILGGLLLGVVSLYPAGPKIETGAARPDVPAARPVVARH